MSTIENIHQRWESLIAEIESELIYIETANICGEDLSLATTRKELQGMPFHEAKYFLKKTLESLELHQAVSLFSWLEKFLFDDAIARKNDKKRKKHSKFTLVNKGTKADGLVKIWKKEFSSAEYKQIFDVIDDARHYRNWVAHGYRSKCLAANPLKNGDTFAAIKLLVDEIARA